MGIWNLFSSSKSSASRITDLSVLKTDIHSHLIPGIDDGSKDIENSIELITSLHELGYQKLITTPHIISDSYRNTPEIILRGLEIVREAVRKQNIPVEIEAAAEYYVDFEFQNKIGKEKLLTFGDNYLLFEVSYLNPPENLEKVIFELQMEGYKPILAHPERYPFWYHTDQYEKFKERGILFQMNINSLTGYYSLKTKKVAEQLIDKGMIDFLGTDCHHMGHISLLNKVGHEKHLHKILMSGKLLNQSI